MVASLPVRYLISAVIAAVIGYILDNYVPLPPINHLLAILAYVIAVIFVILGLFALLSGPRGPRGPVV